MSRTTVGTKSVSEISFQNAFLKSFGMRSDVQHLSTYKSAYDDIDARAGLKEATMKNLIQRKALGPTAPNNTGVGGEGVLVPIYVDDRIIDVSRKQTPAMEIIPRVANMGLSANYNRTTAKGSAYTAAPDAPLPETDHTEERVSEPIKFLYAVGRVLGPSQAAIPAYVLEQSQYQGGVFGDTSYGSPIAQTAMQKNVIQHARALKELEENLFFNGDKSSDPTEFDGFIQLQGSTNVTDNSGANITLDLIEDAVMDAYEDGGFPKVAFCSTGVMKKIRSLLIADYSYRPADMVGNQINALIPATIVLETVVGQIPLYPSRFLDNTNGSQSIWFIDTDVVEMRVLQDMTMEPLAKTNDSDKYMFKIYECLIHRAPEFCSGITNINVTA